MKGRKSVFVVSLALAQFLVFACSKANDAGSDRREVVERCSALVAKNRYGEGAACLRPFESETNPDGQTAVAVFQLGRLYETGHGVPVDPEHALNLYRYAGRLGSFAPDIARQASKSASDLMNKLRETEEDATPAP